MEELLELREHILDHRYEDALDLIAEMEEMSVADKVNKIRSFVRILLLHLIKQQVEGRTTRSWDLSIWNSVQEIHYVNRRRKSKGVYIQASEMTGIVMEAFSGALKRAALEAFGGVYDERQVAAMVSQKDIEEEALRLILSE